MEKRRAGGDCCDRRWRREPEQARWRRLKDGAPLCEIVCIDFDEAREREATESRRLDAYAPSPTFQPAAQLAFLL